MVQFWFNKFYFINKKFFYCGECRIVMKDPKLKNEFILLRAKGYTYNDIAEKLDVSKRTLISWSKDFEYEIANLKATELEVLQEKYYMNKELKIKLFGDKLLAVIEELDKRDLSEIPTEKLFILMIKYSDHLKKENIELIFTDKIGTEEMLMDLEVETWKG